MKVLKLIRDTFLDDRILGTLTIDNEVFQTGERTWQNNEKNISCIPVGTYECCRYWSRRHGLCLMVMDVPNRSGILIHVMNWPNIQSQGCIGVGMSRKDIDGDGVDDLNQSRKALDRILELVGSKETIILDIQEDRKIVFGK